MNVRCECCPLRDILIPQSSSHRCWLLLAGVCGERVRSIIISLARLATIVCRGIHGCALRQRKPTLATARLAAESGRYRSDEEGGVRRRQAERIRHVHLMHFTDALSVENSSTFGTALRLSMSRLSCRPIKIEEGGGTYDINTMSTMAEGETDTGCQRSENEVAGLIFRFQLSFFV